MARRRIDRSGKLQCELCRAWLPYSEYIAKPKNKRGYSSRCISCLKRSDEANGMTSPAYTKEHKARAYENLDRLNEAVGNAKALGMSYGKYKAYLKATPREQEIMLRGI